MKSKTRILTLEELVANVNDKYKKSLARLKKAWFAKRDNWKGYVNGNVIVFLSKTWDITRYNENDELVPVT